MSSSPSTAGECDEAAVRDRYGSPAVVELREVDKPVATDDEVLVRVRAASLNVADWYDMAGRPYVGRTQMGLLKPKANRLGVDYAGTVEAVGRDVREFRPGDDMFGGRNGAFAEYICAREDRAIVPKPANVTFEQAAAVPVAALTAVQGLRDKGRLQPGQKVLINGASGGVGTFAVQIAKALGAEVTGVCSTPNVDIARSLGAAEPMTRALGKAEPATRLRPHAPREARYSIPSCDIPEHWRVRACSPSMRVSLHQFE